MEILSPSNTQAEVDQKCTLYFAAGAREVWICGPDSHIRFFAPEAEVDHSSLCPKFPKRIQIKRAHRD